MARRRRAMEDLVSEEALVSALKEGHREFLRFVSRRVSNMDDAEDVLQDFYLKVVRSARTVNNKGSLRAWLAQVLRRTLTDYYRKRIVMREGRERLKAGGGLELVRIDDEAEQAVCACLYRILPTLAPDQGRLIWRIDLLGAPRAQVAEQLGITANNLAVRIYRARRALRAALLRFCTTCPVHGFLNCACKEARPGRAEREWLENAGEKSVMDRRHERHKAKVRTGYSRMGRRKSVAAARSQSS
jgi:RNA polymerase sigma factor (sigma-70 family)